MTIRQNKSRCEVVGDDGKRVYRTFKNRRDAENYIEYMRLKMDLSNRYWRMDESERQELQRQIDMLRSKFK